MKSVLTKLLYFRGIEYLTVDRNFKIVEVSAHVQKFAEHADVIWAGNDVRAGFPELIGTEVILLSILDEHQPNFQLDAIGRFLENSPPIYLKITAIKNLNEEDLKGELILFFENVTERMLLEQRLVQSTNETNLLLSNLSAARNRQKKIISSMADALIVTSKQGIIKQINPAAEILFEYPENELIGQPLSILVSEQNFLNFVMQGNQFDATEFLKDIEVECQSKSGAKLTVEFSLSTVQTDLENLQDYLYIGRDTTARKRARQRLIVQYAITRILSESVSFEQAKSKILGAICESLGWTLAEVWMVETSFKEEILPESNAELNFSKNLLISPHLSAIKLPNYKRLRCVEIWSLPGAIASEWVRERQQIQLAVGVGLLGRVWAIASPMWVRDIVVPPNLPDTEFIANLGLHAAFAFPIQSDSEVLGVMSFYRAEAQSPDEELLQMMSAVGSQIGQFIKRKQAEFALFESEERYRDLFENASDLIQSVDSNGHFLYVNRAWRETIGYSENELTYLTVFDVIHPDFKDVFLHGFQRVMKGEKIEQIQASFLSKNGRKIFVEGSINCKFIDGKAVATRAIFRDITERLQTEAALQHEREQTERLLLNILPEAIAQRLKREPSTIAENFTNVTVLFADIVGFTQLASHLNPIELVELLNHIFSAFDRLTEQHELEKIKTIGDAYMVVGGLPRRRLDHAEAVAEMALDMQTAIANFNLQNNQAFSIRIGIHSGSVVAGVIGIKKFIYDLWGDTVNVASRMESHGLAGQIQVSTATYALLSDRYLFERRGSIQIKGKGEMTTYLLQGRKIPKPDSDPDTSPKNYYQLTREANQRMIEKINDKLRGN